MCCSECGHSIENTDKFCSKCGKAQNFVIPLVPSITSSSNQELLAVKLHPIKAGIVSRIPTWYWIWVIANLVLLLIFSKSIFDGNSSGIDDFWPFNTCYQCSFASDYDITEFIFYTLMPLIFIFLFSSGKTKTSELPDENKVVQSS